MPLCVYACRYMLSCSGPCGRLTIVKWVPFWNKVFSNNLFIVETLCPLDTDRLFIVETIGPLGRLLIIYYIFTLYFMFVCLNVVNAQVTTKQLTQCHLECVYDQLFGYKTLI